MTLKKLALPIPCFVVLSDPVESDPEPDIVITMGLCMRDRAQSIADGACATHTENDDLAFTDDVIVRVGAFIEGELVFSDEEDLDKGIDDVAEVTELGPTMWGRE